MQLMPSSFALHFPLQTSLSLTWAQSGVVTLVTVVWISSWTATPKAQWTIWNWAQCTRDLCVKSHGIRQPVLKFKCLTLERSRSDLRFKVCKVPRLQTQNSVRGWVRDDSRELPSSHPIFINILLPLSIGWPSLGYFSSFSIFRFRTVGSPMLMCGFNIKGVVSDDTLHCLPRLAVWSTSAGSRSSSQCAVLEGDLSLVSRSPDIFFDLSLSLGPRFVSIFTVFSWSGWGPVASSPNQWCARRPLSVVSVRPRVRFSSPSRLLQSRADGLCCFRKRLRVWLSWVSVGSCSTWHLGRWCVSLIPNVALVFPATVFVFVAPTPAISLRIWHISWARVCNVAFCFRALTFLLLGSVPNVKEKDFHFSLPNVRNI